MYSKIMTLVFLLICWLGGNANATQTLESFSASYSGQFDLSNTSDHFIYTGSTLLTNTNSSLLLDYELVPNLPDFMIAYGNFTYTNADGSFSGFFDLNNNYIEPDLGLSTVPVTGSFTIWDNFLPATGKYANAYGFGSLQGVINPSLAFNFTVDWLIVVPNTVTPVPEMPISWSMLSGFLLILVCLYRKRKLRSAM